MKNKLRILILLLLISSGIFGSVILAQIQNSKIPKQEKFVFLSLEDKISKFRLDSKKLEIVSNFPGAVSKDNKKIAYVKEEEFRQSEKFVYIRNLDSAVSKSIPVKIDQPFKVMNWSQSNEFISIMESAHYVGGLKAHILNVQSGKITNVVELLSDDTVWLDSDEFIFIKPSPPCSGPLTDNCTFYGTVTALNISSSKEQELFRVNSLEGHYPDVFSLGLVDKKISIGYRVYKSNKGILDLNSFEDTWLEYDLETKELVVKEPEYLVESKILMQMKNINQQVDKVEFVSQSEDQYFYHAYSTDNESVNYFHIWDSLENTSQTIKNEN